MISSRTKIDNNLSYDLTLLKFGCSYRVLSVLAIKKLHFGNSTQNLSKSIYQSFLAFLNLTFIYFCQIFCHWLSDFLLITCPNHLQTLICYYFNNFLITLLITFLIISVKFLIEIQISLAGKFQISQFFCRDYYACLF